MSHARIHTLFLDTTNNTSPCNASSNDDFSLDIDWDRSATIGISSILGSMFLISLLLLIFMKRKHRQYTFNVTFKRSQANDPFKSVFIHELLEEKEFSLEELDEIKEIGEHPFIENYLEKLIFERQQQNLHVPSNNLMDVFLKAIVVGPIGELKKSRWDMPSTLEVTMKRDLQKSFRLFEKILPPLMVSSALYEMIFSMPESIGAIALSPNYLPISDSVNMAINYFKVFISLPKNIIFLFFMNFQILFSSSYGAMLDDKIVHTYNWLHHPNFNFFRELGMSSDLNGKYWWTHQLFNLLKIVLMMSLVCEVDVEVESDLQNMKSINQSIISKTHTGIPVWLLFFSAWLSFAHNQLNDPINMIGEAIILLGFANLTEQKIFQKWRLKDELARLKLNSDNETPTTTPRSRLGMFRAAGSDDLEAPFISEPFTPTNNPG